MFLPKETIKESFLIRFFSYGGVMFEKVAWEYFDKELPVVPVLGKAPYTKDWLNHDFSEEIDNHKGKNIGLKCGKVSNIICLDIDVKHKPTQDKIYKLLPPVLCGRIGDKEKGVSYFFQYSGEKSISIPSVIDLLSDGRQCVLPNSIHPNGYPYEWVGKTLLEIDVDDLPIFDMSVIDSIRSILGAPVSTFNCIVESDGTRCSHGSHTKLSEVLVACILDLKSIPDTVDQLISMDENINSRVSYFLCPSRKEWRTNDRIYNANQFAMQGYKRHLEVGKISSVPRVTPSVKIIEKKFEKERYRLPLLRGVAQEMFEIIYENSPIKRSRLAFASSIATMSAMLNNKVHFDGIYTNMYIAMVAKSGMGKNIPLKYPFDLLSKLGRDDLIGIGDIASDNSFLMSLENSQARIDVIDEGSKLFMTAGMKEQYYLSKVADLLAELYTSPGRMFVGKKALSYVTKENEDGILGRCFSPCITMLTATTFTDIENHLTQNLINKGLGARFLFFPDKKFKEQKRIRSRRSSLAINVETFNKFTKGLSEFSMNGPRAVKLEATDQADKFLDDCIAYINKLRRKEDDGMSAINARFYENVIKLGMIDHMGQSYKKLAPIKKASFEWAFDVMVVVNKITQDMLSENVDISESGRLTNKILSVIKSNGKITKSNLTRKIQSYGPRDKRNSSIMDLLQGETITETRENGVTYYES